jgi:hypothetical protein
MMTTPPMGVAGQLQNGALILLTLLDKVDCCYNLMTIHIPNHFLGSVVECIHCFQAMMTLRSRFNA